MEPSVGITINCQTNCFQWCPRKLNCCSFEDESKSNDSDEDVVKNVDEVAKVVLNERPIQERIVSRRCVIL